MFKFALGLTSGVAIGTFGSLIIAILGFAVVLGDRPEVLEDIIKDTYPK